MFLKCLRNGPVAAGLKVFSNPSIFFEFNSETREYLGFIIF